MCKLAKHTFHGNHTQLANLPVQSIITTVMRIGSYREFWPFYVRQHSRKGTRMFHFVGTCGVLACAVLAAVNVNPLWLLAMPVCGYGFAWLGHLLVERNKPATFTYPVWSLVGDFHMFAMMLNGRMNQEVSRYTSQTGTTD